MVQAKLLPTPEQAATLADVLHQVAVAFARFGLRGREAPRRMLCCSDLKADGLSAQVARHVIRRVVDAYTTSRANIHNGRRDSAGRGGRIPGEPEEPLREGEPC